MPIPLSELTPEQRARKLQAHETLYKYAVESRDSWRKFLSQLDAALAARKTYLESGGAIPPEHEFILVYSQDELNKHLEGRSAIEDALAKAEAEVCECEEKLTQLRLELAALTSGNADKNDQPTIPLALLRSETAKLENMLAWLKEQH